MIGSMNITIDFQPGGQVVVTMGQRAKPRRELGTWKIKGGQLHISTKNKTEIMTYHVKGKELFLVPPRQHRISLIFVRPKPTP
jgi:hypothetical protein